MKPCCLRIMRWLWIVALIPGGAAWADTVGIDPLSSMTQIPAQQFVTADPDDSDEGTGGAQDNNASSALTPAPALTQAATPANQQSTDSVNVPLPYTGANIAPSTAPNPPTLPVTTPNAAPSGPPLTPSLNPNPTLNAAPTAGYASVPPVPTPNVVTPPVAVGAAATPQEEVPAPGAALPSAPQPVPLSPNINTPPPNQGFMGGIDKRTFVYCARLSSVICYQAANNANFQNCLGSITQPACQQFLQFAQTVGYSLGDDIDVVQRYDQAQLDLIHIKRAGINYPGDYYALGSKGNLVNITSGPQAQAINITADSRYPDIAQRFPHAQLWSIVEQPPKAETSPQGGLRLVFRFNIMDGCATCGVAGYANVAYDFSPEGMLQQVVLLSLDPL